MGGYGLIRLAWPLAPVGAAAWAYPVAALGVFGILYGALAAMAQTDFKKLVAYSSVSHMGYVTLGMAALTLARDPNYYAFGLNGAVFMMVAHGVTSTGLFFVVGMVYERTHTRDLRALGGLGAAMPGLFGVALVLFFGSMGLPGLCGFVAEVFVTLAAFHFDPVLGALTAFAVVLTAGYMLWAFRRVFQGPPAAGVDRVCRTCPPGNGRSRPPGRADDRAGDLPAAGPRLGRPVGRGRGAGDRRGGGEPPAGRAFRGRSAGQRPLTPRPDSFRLGLPEAPGRVTFPPPDAGPVPLRPGRERDDAVISKDWDALGCRPGRNGISCKFGQGWPLGCSRWP